jgi:hypothetical protein
MKHLYNFVILRPADFAGRRIYANWRQSHLRKQIAQILRFAQDYKGCSG